MWWKLEAMKERMDDEKESPQTKNISWHLAKWTHKYKVASGSQFTNNLKQYKSSPHKEAASSQDYQLADC